MKRNNPASSSPASKATGAPDTPVQIIVAGTGGSSSSSSLSVSGEDQRLTKGNKTASNPSKSYNLADQLYDPDSAYQEQLLLTERTSPQETKGEDQRQLRPGLEASPARFTSRLSALLGKGPAKVGKATSGDQADGDEELLEQESAKTTTVMSKMSRNDKSKNSENTKSRSKQQHNGNGAAGDADLESSSKTGTTSNSRGRTKCCLYVLMAIAAFLITAYLVFMFVPRSADNPRGDSCSDDQETFHNPGNKLFASKTLYATTLSYLSNTPLFTTNGKPLLLTHSSRSPYGSTSPAEGLSLYDKSLLTIPSIFQKDSLESLHEMMNKNSCKLIQLHFYGRHAARLPNDKQITKINTAISAIQKRIVLGTSPKVSATQATSDSDSNEQLLSSTTTMATPPIETGNPVNCTHSLSSFKNWIMFAEPEQGNLLMESGGDETSALALRFKGRFPSMFDGNQTSISFGNTNELRTVQTAVKFVKELVNYELPKEVGCRAEQFPTENTQDKLRGHEITENECLAKFKDRFKKEELSFHDKCEQIFESSHNPKSSIDFNLTSTDLTQSIAEKIMKKLHLAKLDREELIAMYDACRYETALTGDTSIWCSVFSDQDLRFIEYLHDIEDFYGTAFGDEYQKNSSCPLSSNLFDTIYAHAGASRSDLNPTPQAHFHFTHSEVIARFLATLVDLKKDPAYEPDVIKRNLVDGTVPQNRQWRTSLFTPFSANLAFHIYECEKEKLLRSKVFRPKESEFKVITTLNEQPIQVSGCNGVVCDLVQFDSRKPDKCDLSEICSKKIVVK